jgi:hypothetical protein
MERKRAHHQHPSKGSGGPDKAEPGHLDKHNNAAEDIFATERTILAEHRARVRHAIMAYPSFLGLEWNLSLDEVSWVQSYCSRLVVGPHIMTALSSSGQQDGGTAPVVKIEPPSAATDALSWVKRSLLSMTQQHAEEVEVVEDEGCTPSTALCGGVRPHTSHVEVLIESVWQQLSTSASIETGSPSIDRMLHGGLQCGFVTEVVGFAGVGKTCLVANWIAHAVLRGALQDRFKVHSLLAPAVATTTGNDEAPNRSDVNVMLHGGGGCAMCIVVPVGPNLTARRTHQVVKGALQNTSLYRDALSAFPFLNDGHAVEYGPLLAEAEDRIRFVLGVESLDDLTRRVLPLLEAHMIGGSHPARFGGGGNATKRLLVIDSFATLVHCSLSADPRDSLHRHNVLAAFMKRLKSMAEAYQYSIVIVTHATSYAAATSSHSLSASGQQRRQGARQHHHEDGADDVEELLLSDEHSDFHQYAAKEGGGGSSSALSSGSVSAFGNTFYHLVNNRVVLDSVVTDGAIKRVLRIIKSPVCPPVTFEVMQATSEPAALAPTDDTGRELIVCELGDAALQQATDELRRSGVHGRGVFRIPNMKYMNQTSHMTPPVWRIH